MNRYLLRYAPFAESSLSEEVAKYIETHRTCIREGENMWVAMTSSCPLFGSPSVLSKPNAAPNATPKTKNSWKKKVMKVIAALVSPANCNTRSPF